MSFCIAGYIHDQETGLYYLQSRYYDPEMGRFLNADAFTSTGQGFTGNNMFAYCGNNPGNNIDPTGTYYCATKDNRTVCVGGAGDATTLLGFLMTVVSGLSVVESNTKEETKDAREDALATTAVLKQEKRAVYYPADITGSISEQRTWKKYPLKMDFCTAVAWVYSTAASNRYGKNAKWGLYTENQEDAFIIASALGGAVDCPVFHMGESGVHPHYHVAGMDLFGYYKHFHVWYGLENGG